MVSTRLLISKSSSPFTYPLMTIPRAPVTIGITVTFMFRSFFNSLARSRYLSFFSLSINFTLWSVATAKFPIMQVPFFFLFIIRSCRLVEYYYYYYYYHYYYSLRFLHINVGSWAFTLVWVTTSPLRRPEILWVFKPILSMLLSRGLDPLFDFQFL